MIPQPKPSTLALAAIKRGEGMGRDWASYAARAAGKDSPQVKAAK